MLKTKSRENFYAKELDMNRVNEMIGVVASHLTLKEVLKMTREIIYDMTSYYDSDTCGVVYNGSNGDYSKKNVWQATMIGNGARALLDYFQQSIVNKNVFDDGYFGDCVNIGNMRAKIGWQQREIDLLKKQIKDLVEEYEGHYE